MEAESGGHAHYGDIAVVSSINKICAGENTPRDASEEPEKLQAKLPLPKSQ